MKAVASYLTPILFSFLFIACSNDEYDNIESFDVTSTIHVRSNKQAPNNKHDESMFGLYHGIVASGTSLSRGKIWVNIGNDNNFNATIEIVDGSTIEFGLRPQLSSFLENQVFEFESSAGSFVIDLSDYEHPQISEIEIFENAYFGSLMKSRSYAPASAVTAIFVEAGNPSFSGTWSLLSDGTNPNPNGNGGEGITSVMITYDSNMYEDTTFDPFNASQCLGNPSYIPTINSFGTPQYTICDYQTTEFALGMTKWNIGYDPAVSSYINWISCETLASGTFSWTSSDNTIMRLGYIIMD